MSFMSMLIPATSRRNSARVPLADRAHGLVHVGAVELHDVFVPVAAVHGVAALAGVPHEEVLAVSEEHGVVAAAGIDVVVAVTSEDRVDAIAGLDGVVAVSSVDRQFLVGEDGRLLGELVVSVAKGNRDGVEVGKIEMVNVRGVVSERDQRPPWRRHRA